MKHIILAVATIVVALALSGEAPAKKGCYPGFRGIPESKTESLKINR